MSECGCCNKYHDNADGTGRNTCPCDCHALRQRLLESEAKAGEMRKALEAVEWEEDEYDGRMETHCPWCGADGRATNKKHKKSCQRQKALSTPPERSEGKSSNSPSGTAGEGEKEDTLAAVTGLLVKFKQALEQWESFGQQFVGIFENGSLNAQETARWAGGYQTIKKLMEPPSTEGEKA